jgi:Histidine kinase-like ATPase domain
MRKHLIVRAKLRANFDDHLLGYFHVDLALDMNDTAQDSVPRNRHSASASLGNFLPILSRVHWGMEWDRIDVFQAEWSHRIQWFIPELEAARLFDVLLCTREIVLNALVHGCQRREDLKASVDVAWDSSAQLIRVIVEDAGQGHDFDSRSQNPHRGLGLVTQLATRFEMKSPESRVEMDFAYEGVSRAVAS